LSKWASIARSQTTTQNSFFHDIEQDIVNADIWLFLSETLAEMVAFFKIPRIMAPEDKIDVLLHQSNKLFIYTKTICDYIGDRAEMPWNSSTLLRGI
jgi:hypothetical protein